MNNNYYPNNQYGQNPQTNYPTQGYSPDGSTSTPPYLNNQNNLVSFPEYADSVFYVNVGKKIRVYFSYPDSLEWRDKVFTGTIKAAGKDYLIITDDNGMDIMFWIIYINYAEFLETAEVNS